MDELMEWNGLGLLVTGFAAFSWFMVHDEDDHDVLCV